MFGEKPINEKVKDLIEREMSKKNYWVNFFEADSSLVFSSDSEYYSKDMKLQARENSLDLRDQREKEKIESLVKRSLEAGWEY